MSIRFAPSAISDTPGWGRVATAFEAAPHEPHGWTSALKALVEFSGLRAARIEGSQGGGERWPVAAWGKAGGLPYKLVLRSVRDPLPKLLVGAAGAPTAIARASEALAEITHILAQAARTQHTVEAEAIRLAIALLRRTGLEPLVCGPDGALLQEPCAEVLKSAPVRVSCGRIYAPPADEPAFKQALREAVMLGRDRVLLLGRDTDNPTVVDVLPPIQGAAHVFRPHALVLLRGRGADSQERAPILKQLFGLTSAEASVALAVARGAQVDEIARRRGVASSTVRAQVKAILAKVGVGRQVELAHRLAAVC